VPDAFRALADPTRREILRLLRDGPRTSGQIAEHFASSGSGAPRGALSVFEPFIIRVARAQRASTINAVALPHSRLSPRNALDFQLSPMKSDPLQRENLAIPRGKPLAYALESYTFTPDGPAVSW
jgi:hypothetical protein